MSETEGIGFWPLTDVGRVRKHNEDSFLIDKKLKLFICADGMGGHAAGEVASRLAAQTVRDVMVGAQAAVTSFAEGQNDIGRTDILRLLESALQQACSTVYNEGQEDESKRGMGTTLDALLLVGSRGFIAHVGDSRVYLYRQGAVHQLTEDHSLVNELVRRGRLTRKQIEKLQYKNAVTRAIGVYGSVEVDTLDFDVLQGDRFLLCSDGLSGYVDDAELAQLFSQTAPEELAPKLIDLANERGGKDNITAIVIKVPEPEAGVDRLAREVNLKLEVLHKMPLFRHLTYQELVRVLNITEVRSYAADTPIVTEGDQGDELFIVLTGKVRVHAGETTLSHLGPGEHVGEMALIDRAPRSAGVDAEESSKLLVIRRRDFFDIIRKEHAIAVKLLWSFLGVLTGRLRDTNQQLGEVISAEDVTASFLAPDGAIDR